MLPLNSAIAKESSPQALNIKEKLLALPEPSEEARAHSEKLMALLKERLAASSESCISFAEYMQLALFAPGLGYYSAGNQKFGAKGDFITAPEISPLFSQCLAEQCRQGLEVLGEDACLLEIGAGTGQMAADILKTLKKLKTLPTRYYILELSAELKERQHTTLNTQCPELLPLVQWLDELPQNPLKAIILANEVCDAMPVQRFCLKDDGIRELAVGINTEKLCLIETKPSETLRHELECLLEILGETLEQELTINIEQGSSHNTENFTNVSKNNSNSLSAKQKRRDLAIKTLLTGSKHYTSEINLNIKPWLKSLSEILDAGVILVIDYGFSRQEYYHASRWMGTLMCHYRHHAHHDVFFYPGLQDITAHVDFTLIAEGAFLANLEVMGFTNQASFLIHSGLLNFAEKAQQLGLSERDFFRQAQAIQLLTSPTEMGELFKVMALSKNFEGELTGFSLNDMRYQL